MNLLLDMSLSPVLCGVLNSAGFEAVHWSAVGEFNATDPELMLYAARQNYAVITHDLDFGASLATSFQGVLTALGMICKRLQLSI